MRAGGDLLINLLAKAASRPLETRREKTDEIYDGRNLPDGAAIASCSPVIET
jgi:hypothetical protein